MNIVEFRFEGNDHYTFLCVSVDKLSNYQITALLKNEQWFSSNDVVWWDIHTAWEENAVFFNASGAFCGVFVRQSKVKVYHPISPNYDKVENKQ